MAKTWGRRLARIPAIVGAATIMLVLVAPTAWAATVTMNGNSAKFTPPVTTIERNETVTWKYTSHDYTQGTEYVYHTVTSRPSSAERFDSDPKNDCSDRSLEAACIGPNEDAQRQSFSHKFTKVGTFDYYCKIHGNEGMTGKVIVVAPPTPAPTAPPAPPATQAPGAPQQTVAPAPTATASPSPTSSPTASVEPTSTVQALPIESDDSGSNTGVIAALVLVGVAVVGGAVALAYSRRRVV